MTPNYNYGSKLSVLGLFKIRMRPQLKNRGVELEFTTSKKLSKNSPSMRHWPSPTNKYASPGPSEEHTTVALRSSTQVNSRRPWKQGLIPGAISRGGSEL
mgnify:CR=1 FL=1